MNDVRPCPWYLRSVVKAKKTIAQSLLSSVMWLLVGGFDVSLWSFHFKKYIFVRCLHSDFFLFQSHECMLQV